MEKRTYSSVFVIDYTWEGHIPTYHKYICSALLELGYKVYSISPQPADVEEWVNAQAGDVVNKIQYDYWQKPAEKQNSNADAGQISAPAIQAATRRTSFKQRIINRMLSMPYIKQILNVHEVWKTAQNRIAQILPRWQHRGDVFVLMPYLDMKLLAPGYGGFLFSRAFKLPWAGVFFHPTFLRKQTGTLKMPGIFKSPTCRSVALLDEGVIEKFEYVAGKKTVQFPDITNDELDASSLTKLANDVKAKAGARKIISLIGVISNKKNVLTLIKAIQLSNERKLRFYFLIAGGGNKYYWSNEKEYGEMVAAVGNTDNTWWHLEALKDGHEYNSLVAVSDVLMASYRNFYHSSNTLTKAAIFQKPLVVSRGYLMEERIRRYDMGIAIDENDAEMLITAIEKLANGVNENGEKMKPQYDRYRQMHNYKRLKQALVEMIV